MDAEFLLLQLSLLALIGVIVIDLETMLIPDRFSMGGAGFFLSCFPSIHQVDFHPLGMESCLPDAFIRRYFVVGSTLLDWFCNGQLLVVMP